MSDNQQTTEATKTTTLAGGVRVTRRPLAESTDTSPAAWRWLRTKVSGNNSMVLITTALFVFIYVVGAIVFSKKNFGSLNSFFDMLNSNPGLIIIAAGMTMVIISGGIDISVGGQVAMYCMMLAFYMRAGANAYVIIAVVLVTGVVFGLVQGTLVAYFRIQPFIVSLAGMFFARGMTAVISPDTIEITNKQFMALAKYKIYSPIGGYANAAGVWQQPFVYPSVVMGVVMVLILWVVMTRTKFGRSVYAVGGSEQSALLMGLNVKRIKLAVYTFNGFIAAFGGFLFCLSSPGGSVEKAPAFEMKAIASAVIGGAMLTGGIGNILGSFIGVLVQTAITKIINFQGTLSSGWSEIVLAVLMSLFIVLQAILTSARRKRN